MSKISELVGLDKKIEQVVEKALCDKDVSMVMISAAIRKQIGVLSPDVYSNMQQIEKQNYRMVEIETKLDNLAAFVKLHLPGGGE